MSGQIPDGYFWHIRSINEKGESSALCDPKIGGYLTSKWPGVTCKNCNKFRPKKKKLL